MTHQEERKKLQKPLKNTIQKHGNKGRESTLKDLLTLEKAVVNGLYGMEGFLAQAAIAISGIAIKRPERAKHLIHRIESTTQEYLDEIRHAVQIVERRK